MTTRTDNDRHAIEDYAVALAADGIESLAEDDLNEDGDIAEELHSEACDLAIAIARGIKAWPAVAFELAERFRALQPAEEVQP